MVERNQLSEKQREVYNILRTPIVCRVGIDTPYLCDGKIYSGQRYRTVSGRTPDADMSDFAVGYYEIIYDELFQKQSLLNAKSGFLTNCCFAGDTMNSFNSIANVTPGAGKSIKIRKGIPVEKWDSKLLNYYNSYHCLANFWIIPSCIGRKSKKLNRFDSMDIFLDLLQRDYDEVLKGYSDYYLKIDEFKKFIQIHFLKGYFPIEKIAYKEENAYRLIEQSMQRIDERAFLIAASNDCCDRLWRYFRDLGLLIEQ